MKLRIPDLITSPIGAAVSLSVPAPDKLMYILTCFKLNIYFAFPWVLSDDVSAAMKPAGSPAGF